MKVNVKNELCCKDQSQITYELLSYLAEHPDSRDTIEGIMQWWLLERKIKYQKALIEKSLVELIQKGFVLQTKRNDSKDQYCVNQQRREDIQALLKQRQV